MNRVRAVLTALVVVLLALPALATAASRGDSLGTEAKSGKSSSSTYIVRMLEDPVVAYDGGISGYKATKPAKGNKINPNDPDVVKYYGYLKNRHDAALSSVGGAKKLYDYGYVFNGFAADLSPGQVAKLEKADGVVAVEKDELGRVDTATTPAFMGLSQTGGAWDQLGGKGKAGEDVIIGIVDTGINPDSHGSFSDRTGTGPNGQDGRLGYQRIPGWHGRCVPGEGWTAENCGEKLIGAQFYSAGFGVASIAERDFLSPRDYNGHGSHTASTAGGNADVPATGPAALFGNVNGMAPRARIAAYKVCWEDQGDGGCANSDSVAAIDQAVADGVDVINFSISGTSTNYLAAVEVAFLFAADAGVFVATSAGNSGPGASTVAHISPWLAATAAGTHNRSGTATVTLGNGATYTGASLTNAVGPAQLVKSTSVGLAGKPADDVRLCFIGALDPAKVAGKIVQCDRGVNARVDKSAEVKRANGVGMILTNVTPSSLNADLHSVPTVHVSDTDRGPIQAYIDSAGASATATLSTAVVNNSAPAPEVASFSSRGPSIAGGGDILKPDFMAPGVDILAAVSPAPAGREFDLLSGTSMSSPHVAGFGALLTQKHPDWSPAAMRSALATTAHQSIVGGYNPFGAGSGQVRPTLALDPGLVYDASFNDYLAFLKGQRLCCAASASIPALDASDLNQPSIAIGDLAGVQTVTRTVTNVGGSSATYTATVNNPAGHTVVVSPSSFTIAPGAKQAFTVTITRTTGTLNAYALGFLTWSDGSHSVRSPIVVRPVAIAAPTELTLTGTSGATSYQIKTGYNGTLSYAKRGLIPSQVFSGTVADDPTSNFDTGHPADNQGITTHDITVAAGTSLLRISMFDPETDGEDDIDLYLYRVNADSTLTLVGASGGGTSAEQIQITPPAAGANYKLFVHGWQTDGPDAVYKLHSWALGTTDAGNMTVTGPNTATIGGTGTVNMSWAGLDAGKRYLGQIRYMDGTTTHGTTIVRVDG